MKINLHTVASSNNKVAEYHSHPLGKVQVSLTHPGLIPDNVLTMPNWFVVLEGFPVVFHGFPVVVNQEHVLLEILKKKA